MIPKKFEEQLDDSASKQFEEFELQCERQEAVLGGGAFNSVIGAKPGLVSAALRQAVISSNKTRR